MRERTRMVFAADGGGAGGGAGAGTGAAGGDWTSGLEPDLRTAVQTKGYKTPGELAKAYVTLESKIGLDKLALPAKDAAGNRDWAKWDGWTALGRPDSPDKYDLTGFKPPEGVTLEDARVKGYLAHAHKLGLTQAQALGTLEFYGADIAGLMKTQADARSASDAQLQTDMTTKWGAAKDAKLDLAKRAARALGFKDEHLDKIEATIGSFAMLDAFAGLGDKYFSEHGKLPSGQSPGGALTPADADAEIKKLQAHPGYLDPKHPEHQQLHERALALFAMKNPAPAAT